MAINIAVKIAFNRIRDVRNANFLSSVSDQSTWVRGYFMALYTADLVTGAEYDRLCDLLTNAAAKRTAELREEIKKGQINVEYTLDVTF